MHEKVKQKIDFKVIHKKTLLLLLKRKHWTIKYL